VRRGGKKGSENIFSENGNERKKGESERGRRRTSAGIGGGKGVELFKFYYLVEWEGGKEENGARREGRGGKPCRLRGDYRKRERGGKKKGG